MFNIFLTFQCRTWKKRQKHPTWITFNPWYPQRDSTNHPSIKDLSFQVFVMTFLYQIFSKDLSLLSIIHYFSSQAFSMTSPYLFEGFFFYFNSFMKRDVENLSSNSSLLYEWDLALKLKILIWKVKIVLFFLLIQSEFCIKLVLLFCSVCVQYEITFCKCERDGPYAVCSYA